MSYHNIGFNEDLTKIIFESNTHLISSAESSSMHHDLMPLTYISHSIDFDITLFQV